LTTAPRVLFATFVALLLATLLNAETLLESAERMELGPRRDAAVRVVEPIVSVSARLRTDRPGRQARSWLGRDQPLSVRDLPSVVAPERAPLSMAIEGEAPEIRRYLQELAEGEATGRCALETGPSGRRIVTPDDPLRVLLIGDSLMEHLGPPARSELEAFGVVDVELDWRYSTGLSRPDYFDWPARMQVRLAEAPPEVVVVLFGGNDGQNLKRGRRVLRTATPAWTAEYSQRVVAFARLLAEEGRFVYWIGLPIMRDGSWVRKATAMNSGFERAGRVGPRVRFVPAWRLFADHQGGYAEYLPDETGRRRLVRAQDGVHFTKDGARRLARHLVRTLDEDWELDRWWNAEEPIACAP
jgi:uncharacterized protein